MTDLGDRTRYLGASELAPILGVPGAYRGAMEVWLEKTGRVAREPLVGPLLDLGHLLEPVILDAATQLVHPGAWSRGRPWRAEEYVYDDPALPLRGHADAVCCGEIFEAKVLVYSDIERVRLAHEVQVRAYMALSGAQRGHLAYAEVPRRVEVEHMVGLLSLVEAARGGGVTDAAERLRDAGVQLHVLTIEADEALEAEILRRASEWWRRHVVEGAEPDVDGSRAAAEWLGRRHPVAVREVVRDDSDEAAALVREYVEVSAQLRALDARKDALANQLKARIGDAGAIVTTTGRASWSRYTTTRIDVERVRADHGDRYDIVQPQSRLTVKEAK